MTKYNCINGKMVAHSQDVEDIVCALPSTDDFKRDKRRERNELLAETDWMAGSDYTMTDAWKTYRQALRDLPAADGFPDVDFPTKPS